jgi:hypothetical protein
MSALEILEDGELHLLRALDALFLSWAHETDAVERRYPFLARTLDLDVVDYYDNSPHLFMAATTAEPARLADALAGAERPIVALSNAVLCDAWFVLPPAACYWVYFSLRGTDVPAEGCRYTTAATCFCAEERDDGLRGPLARTMREIVYVGTAGGANEHVAVFEQRVDDLAGRLDLAITTAVSTAPAVERNGSGALAPPAFPAKRDVLVGGLPVSSVSYHRDFFGERCAITLPDGNAAHTSCVGFGLECWVHALLERYGDPARAVERLTDLR